MRCDTPALSRVSLLAVQGLLLRYVQVCGRTCAHWCVLMYTLQSSCREGSRDVQLHFTTQRSAHCDEPCGPPRGHLLLPELWVRSSSKLDLAGGGRANPAAAANANHLSFLQQEPIQAGLLPLNEGMRGARSRCCWRCGCARASG